MGRLGHVTWWACCIFLGCRPSSDPLPDGGSIDAGTLPGVVRAFTCVPAPPGNLQDVLDMDARPGETVAIRATASACQFELLLQRTGGSLRLDREPSGYLVGTSEGATGHGAICFANIHHRVDTAAPRLSQGREGHRIDRVDVECAVELEGGNWSQVGVVVEGGTDWAAWPSSVTWDEALGTWKVAWIRDSRFQFLSLNERGRPPSDGLFETEIRSTSTGPVPFKTTKVNDQTLSDPSVTDGGVP